MIGDCLLCRCRGLSCVQGVRMIDDCLFCRCRGLSCVQGVRMIDDCLFCKSSIILTELHEHKKDHDIYKTNNHLSS
jgi:hypothetical protein